MIEHESSHTEPLRYRYDVRELAKEWSVPNERTRSAISDFKHDEERRAYFEIENDTTLIDRVLTYAANSSTVDPLTFAATFIDIQEQHTMLAETEVKDIRWILDSAAELSANRIQTALNLGTINQRHFHEDRLNIHKVVGIVNQRAYDNDPQETLFRIRNLQLSLNILDDGPSGVAKVTRPSH